MSVSNVMPIQTARHANLSRLLRWLEEHAVVGLAAQAAFLGNTVTVHKLESMVAGSEVPVLFARHIEVFLHLPRNWMDDAGAPMSALVWTGRPSTSAYQGGTDGAHSDRDVPAGAG
jgi:hypothetical protein